MLRTLWHQHGARLRHWLAVLLTIVLVLSYMEWRDTGGDWTVLVLAVGLLLVLEFVLSGSWLRRDSPRRERPGERGRRR